MSERIDVPLGAGPVRVSSSAGDAGAGEHAAERLDAGGAADAAGAAQTAETAAIREEIRDTRERVGDTLERIGERLNPHRVAEQVKAQVKGQVREATEHVKENVRDATIGRVGDMARHAADRAGETRSTVMDTIRANPVPAAMVGLGLGWLFMNRARGPSRDPRAFSGAAPYGAGYAGYENAGYENAGYETDDAGGRGPVDRARERAGEVGREVKETASGLADRAQDVAGTVAERTQDVASSVAQRTRSQARRVEDRYYEAPLAVGAATLALGLAAGLALPKTDAEVSLMGEARDRLVDRAREVAGETKEKVQQVAQRVLDEGKGTAAEAARTEGLTSS